jgi:hypothetical protein
MTTIANIAITKRCRPRHCPRPTEPKISAGSTAKLRWSIAVVSGKRLISPSTAMIGAVGHDLPAGSASNVAAASVGLAGYVATLAFRPRCRGMGKPECASRFGGAERDVDMKSGTINTRFDPWPSSCREGGHETASVLVAALGLG